MVLAGCAAPAAGPAPTAEGTPPASESGTPTSTATAPEATTPTSAAPTPQETPPATIVESVTPDSTAPKSDSAAINFDWGAPIDGDEFDYVGAPDPTKWSVYNSAGHAGNGIRSPQQAAVDGSKMVITGTPEGTTAGMSAKFGRQKYGRWETRAAGSGDNEYHLVLLLWPDSRNWPCDGEVDYAETTGDWNLIKFFHHYSCNNSQTIGAKALDVSQFHNYAVDWSPNGIVGYVDGVKWFEDADPTHQPPGPMHQTLQLDWFPDGSPNGPGEMRVDWVRVYAAAEAGAPPAP